MENKTTYSGSDVLTLFSKLEKKIESLTCFVRECCSKIPVNIGRGLGLYRRLSSGKWQFKTLLAGDNITLIETTEEIVISASSSTPSCQDINNCLGISESGSDNKFLNEQGDFISISSLDVTTALGYTPYDSTNPSGFLTSSSLTPYLLSSTAASTYQPIGSYLTTISGLNISLLNNDSNYLTSSTASSTYEPIITPGTTSQYYRGDKTFQTLDKSTIGLGNVDNTSDSNKPISTATQNALDLKANKSEVATVLFKSVTQTIITGKTLETCIYAIPLPRDGFNYMINVYSQAQVTTFLGLGISQKFRVGSFASPIDGVAGTNSIGLQTILATNGVASPNQIPLKRNFTLYGGASGSIYGISTAGNIPDDANTLVSFTSLASKDFTVQNYLYVSFNPSNAGAVVQHNQILVTAIKI